MPRNLALTLVLFASCASFANAGLVPFSFEKQPGNVGTTSVNTDYQLSGTAISLTGAPIPNANVQVVTTDQGTNQQLTTVIPSTLSAPSLIPLGNAIAPHVSTITPPSAADVTIHGGLSGISVAAATNWLAIEMTQHGIQIPVDSTVATDASQFNFRPSSASILGLDATVMLASSGSNSYTWDPPVVSGNALYGLIGQDGHGGLVASFAPGVTETGKTFFSVFGIPEVTALSIFNNSSLLTSPSDVALVSRALLNHTSLLPLLNEGQSNAVTANLVDFTLNSKGVEQPGVSDGTATEYFTVPTPTPEPATVTLLAIGAACFAGKLWRRRSRDRGLAHE